MKLGNNLHFNGYQALSALFEVLGADPGSPAEGRVWYRSDLDKVRIATPTIRSLLDDTTRLDQLAAATADIAANGQKITNLGTPTASGDAATKGYVDGAIQGIDWVTARVASLANLGLSGTSTVDGVSISAGDVILAKNQTAQAENGLYVAAAGAWTRHPAMDAASEIDGKVVIVEDGTQAGTLWITTSEVTTLGTDAITFAQFNSVADLVAGAGLTKTGTTVDVNVDNSSIEINADTLRVKAGGITEAMLADNSVTLDDSQGTVAGTLAIGNGGTGATTAAAARAALGTTGKFAADITGDAATTAFAVTHNLGTKDVTVQVWEVTTDEWVIVDIVRTSTNVVTVTFGAAPAAAKVYRVVVTG